MFIDIALTDEEVDRLRKGGFMRMDFPNGIRVAVTIDHDKDRIDEEDFEK